MDLILKAEFDEALEEIKKNCELGRKSAARRLLSSREISAGDLITYPDGDEDIEFRVEACLSDGEILLVEENNTKNSFALFVTEFA